MDLYVPDLFDSCSYFLDATSFYNGMKPLGDLNWRLAPLVSFMNAMGGWGPLFIRRIGIPVVILIFTFLYYDVKKKRYWVLYPILAVSIFAALSLPVTLIGDSVHGHWLNWVWLWALGASQGLSLLPLAFFGRSKIQRWCEALVMHTFAVGILLTLSNTWGYPTHAWVEAGIGISFGGCAAWLIEET